MRWLASFALLASSVALAGPSKAVRKPAPPDMKPERIEYFVDGVMLDKAGDFDLAISRYRSSSDGMAHANVAYNIADIARRMEDWPRAIEMYKKYLELAPDAPDRAAVQKLIEQIQKAPQAIYVDGDDFDAVVFIDGKPAGPSPLATTLTEGDHVVDRIGPTSYHHDWIRARPMQHKHVSSNREATGNVVMSTSSSYGGSWKDGDVTYKMERFSLPAGRYDTFFMKPGFACSPISFQVPADGLVFVYIDAPREKKSGECTPIKVTAQKIQFPGLKK